MVFYHKRQSPAIAGLCRLNVKNYRRRVAFFFVVFRFVVFFAFLRAGAFFLAAAFRAGALFLAVAFRFFAAMMC
jgi:hypothetical protein